MRAISLWQPWASAIATGSKRFETRGWPFPDWLMGQTIAIHAAQKPFGSAMRESGITDPDDWWDYMVAAGMSPAAAHACDGKPDLPLGKIVAVATVTGCVPTHQMLPQDLSHRREVEHGGVMYGLDEQDLGNYGPGRFAWRMDGVLALERPIPCKGKQGFFFLTDDVEAAVRGQLGGRPEFATADQIFILVCLERGCELIYSHDREEWILLGLKDCSVFVAIRQHVETLLGRGWLRRHPIAHDHLELTTDGRSAIYA